MPLQGGADATMSYAGAAAAVLAGPLLAVGGFRLVNVAAAVVLVPVLVTLAAARRASATVTAASGDLPVDPGSADL